MKDREIKLGILFSKNVILKVYTENYKTLLKEIKDLKIERQPMFMD